MSSVYTPTAVALTPITIPSDGDAPIQASDVNPAFEALADGITFVDRRLRQTLLTAASGTWTVPPDVIAVGVYLFGGGGGGGGGFNGHVGTDSWPYGGGGGGSARPIFAIVRNIAPGEVLLYQCGAAGAAGTGGVFGGAAPTAGGDGGSSVIMNPAGSVVLAQCDGAAGGRAGVAYQGVVIAAVIPGGANNALSPSPPWIPCAYHLAALPCGVDGCGGASSPYQQFLVGKAFVGGGLALGSQGGGRQPPRSYAVGSPPVGGAAGADGANAGAGPFFYGGVGGGGGAGGAGGSGGGGGAGGAANAAGNGAAGNAGGAGSNGGGGGGAGSGGAPGNGGAGGAGGQGNMVIAYVSSSVAVFT